MYYTTNSAIAPPKRPAQKIRPGRADRPQNLELDFIMAPLPDPLASAVLAIAHHFGINDARDPVRSPDGKGIYVHADGGFRFLSFPFLEDGFMRLLAEEPQPVPVQTSARYDLFG